ncbi:MAG TPA: hypothetical protein PK765_02170 [bacterium]|mgnify:CR=1 FL=1|nr:hypothetical protein [bacterium]
MERLSSSDSCTTRPQNEIIDADAVRRMVADDRLDSEEARMILTKYLKIRGDLETLRDRRKVEISAETKEAWNALDKAVRARIQRDLPVEDDGVIGPYTISRLAVRALSSDQAHQSLSCEAKPDLAATAETQTEPVLPRGKDEGDKTNTPSAS